MSEIYYSKRFLPPILLIFWLYSCSPANRLPADDRPEFSYGQYSSYTLVQTVPAGSENPALTWPQLYERIRKNLNFHLPSVGLDPVSADPDLYIYIYVLAETDDLRPVAPYRIGWRAESFLAAGERLSEYPPNTLVLDFVDPDLDELVWRGSTGLPLESQKKTNEVLGSRIKKLVQRYPKPPS